MKTISEKKTVNLLILFMVIFAVAATANLMLLSSNSITPNGAFIIFTAGVAIYSIRKIIIFTLSLIKNAISEGINNATHHK